VNKSLCCANCGEVVLKSVNGELKMRSKITIFKNGGAYAVCKGCSTEIQIPVSIDEKMMKSVSQLGSLKLFIKK
jgi:ribosomal protein S27E